MMKLLETVTACTSVINDYSRGQKFTTACKERVHRVGLRFQ